MPEPLLSSFRSQRCGHVHAELGKQPRRRLLAAGVRAMHRVFGALKRQDGDLPFLGVDDPVLGDAGPGIVGSFLHQVALSVAGAAGLPVRSEPSILRPLGTEPAFRDHFLSRVESNGVSTLRIEITVN